MTSTNGYPYDEPRPIALSRSREELIAIWHVAHKILANAETLLHEVYVPHVAELEAIFQSQLERLAELAEGGRDF